MKKTNLIFLLSLLVSVIAFSSCDDDEKVEKSAYIGNYTIQKATLAEALPLEIIYGGETMTVPFPVGRDFTDMIHNALLSAVPSCSADASLIELREDFSMYLSCTSSSWNLNAGTWKENGADLILTFNKDAIPYSETGFTLTNTDVEIKGGVLHSTSVIPISRAALAAAMEESGQALLTENNPDPIMFTFNLEFKIQ